MKRLLLAAALLACSAISSHATDYRFAFPAPPQSLINVWGFEPWAKEVKEATKGAVDIKIIPGPTLGTFGTIYDRTANGVADMSFGTIAAMSARFPKTEVVNVPFQVENPLEGSIALWRLYSKGVIADEFKDVKLLGLFAFGNPAVQTKDKEVKSIADIAGMKLAAGSKVDNDFLAMLGAAPQSAEPPDLYQGISRGLYEGALIQWTAFQTFKLAEVTKYHFDLPLGSAGAYIAMNKSAYDKMPAEAKAAFDKLTGESLARRMGEVISRMDTGAHEQAKSLGGHTFHTMPAGERETWAPKVQPLIDSWVRNTSNGEVVLSSLRKELADIRAGK